MTTEQRYREFWRSVRLMSKSHRNLRIPSGVPVEMQLRIADMICNPPVMYDDVLGLLGTVSKAVFRVPTYR